MFEPTAAQTAAGMQYIADHESIRVDGTALRTVTSPDKAANVIRAEITDRLTAVFEALRGQPIVLLSGGIDSILVATAATTLGAHPHAITVITEEDTDDYGAACAAAYTLGLTHQVITLDHDDVVNLAQQATTALGTSELWEIAAAMPLMAAKNAIAEHAVRQPGPSAILTGSGADAVFAGGRQVTAPLDTDEAVAEMDAFIRAEVGGNFVRDRLVPDFYERIFADYAPSLIHVFQTERFWEIGKQLAPTALFGDVDGTRRDKLPLRIACEQLLPADAAALAWTRKSPIQRSTGLIAALTRAARDAAAALPGASTYADPLTEPIEATAIRLYLHSLAAS